jgi:geranylgeranyl diphosphate synthase type I
VELIHNFSLLHDDVQDQSPLRRNRATVWSIWGDAQAINAGDALFVLAHLAFPRLAEPGTDGTLLMSMIEILDATCLELTRGQHLDLDFEKRDDVTEEGYQDMIRGKTAALIASAAHLGALAGQADNAKQTHYRAFGEHLGMAFQVRDDILDIWGDPKLTGKKLAHDIWQRKKSLPVIHGLERSQELRRYYADPEPFDEQRVRDVIRLLEDVGAKRHAESIVEIHSKQTRSHLKAAQPEGDAGEALTEMVNYLLERNY